MFTDISEVLAAFINRVMTDDVGSNHIRKIGKLLPDYMVQQPKRQQSSS
jgi:hypothetical protein